MPSLTVPPRSSRLQTITPPPPLRDGEGTGPACLVVLHEVDGPLGALLWVGLRRVYAWVRRRAEAETAAARAALEEKARARKRRAGNGEGAEGDAGAALAEIDGALASLKAAPPTFRSPSVTDQECHAAAVEAAPELADALCTFALLHQAPGMVPAERMADACERVKVWADAAGLLETATHFAEAAAYVDAEDPGKANQAGRFCRRAALNTRSGGWFYRAFGLAVRRKAHRECTQALIGYGALMFQLGEYGEAQRFLWRAYRRAQRNHQRQKAARACHELLNLAAEVRNYPAGEGHAQRALALYPRSDASVPHLVHDYAYLLSEGGLFAPAVPLLQAVAPLVTVPGDRAMVLGNLARAAAGAGHYDLYRQAAAKALQLAEAHPEHASGVWSVTAVGALLAGERECAAELAKRALAHALGRKERHPAQRAWLTLDMIDRGAAPPKHEKAAPEFRIESLSRECLVRLRQWQPRASDTRAHGSAD